MTNKKWLTFSIILVVLGFYIYFNTGISELLNIELLNLTLPFHEYIAFLAILVGAVLFDGPPDDVNILKKVSIPYLIISAGVLVLYYKLNSWSAIKQELIGSVFSIFLVSSFIAVVMKELLSD